jgi:hypothetical protein
MILTVHNCSQLQRMELGFLQVFKILVRALTELRWQCKHSAGFP